MSVMSENLTNKNNKDHILESATTPDGILRVVLRRFNGELVTHIENVQCGGYSHGNYFHKEEGRAAILNFLKRCRKYKVLPKF